MGAGPAHDPGISPAVWFFGNNDNYVGQTLKTDPNVPTGRALDT